jgi:hypothetical protein
MRTRISWKDRTEISNIDIILLMLCSMCLGFVLAYLFYGKGIPW